jgi:hypothetical protein
MMLTVIRTSCHAYSCRNFTNIVMLFGPAINNVEGQGGGVEDLEHNWIEQC